jgi:hypothetical protein
MVFEFSKWLWCFLQHIVAKATTSAQTTAGGLKGFPFIFSKGKRSVFEVRLAMRIPPLSLKNGRLGSRNFRRFVE